MQTPGALDPEVRLQTKPAATRALGSDLLVNVGGSTAPVHRLMGIGGELWWAFAEGLTVGEVATRIAAEKGASVSEVQPHVARFAADLVRSELAEPIA